MVSPVDKAGSDIRSFTTLGGTPVAIDQADLSGDKLTYSSARRFGDAVSQPYVVQYLASRGAGGWSTHGISPPRGAYLGSFELADNEFRAFSPDLCRAWLVNDETSGPVQAPGATEREKNLYERTNCGSGSDGYRLLMAGEEGVVQGLASDGTTLVRSGTGKLSLFGASGGGTPVCLLPDETESFRLLGGDGGTRTGVRKQRHQRVLARRPLRLLERGERRPRADLPAHKPRAGAERARARRGERQGRYHRGLGDGGERDRAKAGNSRSGSRSPRPPSRAGRSPTGRRCRRWGPAR